MHRHDAGRGGRTAAPSPAIIRGPCIRPPAGPSSPMGRSRRSAGARPGLPARLRDPSGCSGKRGRGASDRTWARRAAAPGPDCGHRERLPPTTPQNGPDRRSGPTLNLGAAARATLRQEPTNQRCRRGQTQGGGAPGADALGAWTEVGCGRQATARAEAPIEMKRMLSHRTDLGGHGRGSSRTERTSPAVDRRMRAPSATLVVARADPDACGKSVGVGAVLPCALPSIRGISGAPAGGRRQPRRSHAEDRPAHGGRDLRGRRVRAWPCRPPPARGTVGTRVWQLECVECRFLNSSRLHAVPRAEGPRWKSAGLRSSSRWRAP